MTDTAALQPTILDAAAVAGLSEQPLGPMAGVSNQVLWTDGTSMAGVLRIEAGHQLGAHTHRANHHHMWVLDGEVVILDRQLGPGSYVHIPAGVEHDIDATQTAGATVYYLYLLQAD